VPPELRHSDREDECESFSGKVLVVDIETGWATDSGTSNRYPNLASVGPVITDYRASS
jgi:hypothetical protein